MKLLAGGVRISSTSEKDGEREGRLRSRFEMVGGEFMEIPLGMVWGGILWQ